MSDMLGESKQVSVSSYENDFFAIKICMTERAKKLFIEEAERISWNKFEEDFPFFFSVLEKIKRK